jgi:hypothetical protein
MGSYQNYQVMVDSFKKKELLLCFPLGVPTIHNARYSIFKQQCDSYLKTNWIVTDGYYVMLREGSVKSST